MNSTIEQKLESGTAERAKPMWGDELYQERARRAFPVLTSMAQASQTATYSELARKLRMRNPRNLNFVLGSVGASLSELSRQWGELIPPIEAIVVNSQSDGPSSGVDHFLSRVSGIVPSDRQERIAHAREQVFSYPDWNRVQAALDAAWRQARFGQEVDFKPDSIPAKRYWWVNHNQTHRQELAGEYLWSPKRNQNGAKNVSYDNMARVLPGDVVYSFAGGTLRAVGVALARAREATQPPEFGKSGEQWGSDLGWQVPVRFQEFASPLKPREHRAVLAPVLPAKHSPIRATGDGNQGVYLASIPQAMADVLEKLLDGQVGTIVEAITQTTGGSVADDAAQEAIQQRTDIGETEKLNLVKSRGGQGVYRQNLELIELQCRVTGLLDRRHLRASHIKPWCICENPERLDGFNGLLLSPHIDHLFDRGHISFSDEGDLKVSRHLNPGVLEAWGITLPRNVGAFRDKQRPYLKYHRTYVFEKAKGGWRGAPSATEGDPGASDESGSAAVAESEEV